MGENGLPDTVGFFVHPVKKEVATDIEAHCSKELGGYAVIVAVFIGVDKGINHTEENAGKNPGKPFRVAAFFQKLRHNAAEEDILRKGGYKHKVDPLIHRVDIVYFAEDDRKDKEHKIGSA